MSELGESLGKRVIWHIAKIPIIAIFLFVLISYGPLPYAQGGPIGCTCQECEFVDWYNSIGGFERLLYNLREIMQSFFS